MLGVNTIEEHDDTIIRRCNATVNKRDWLYILGDLGDHTRIDEIKCNKKIFLGNHDKRPLEEYMSLKNSKIIWCVPYKKNWITHIPIIQEDLFQRDNIHGHVHSKSIMNERYINVCIETTCGWPIAFDYIRERDFRTCGIFTPEQAWEQMKGLGYMDWPERYPG